MQNLLQPGCSSELEKDGGEDQGGVISFLDFFGQTGLVNITKRRALWRVYPWSYLKAYHTVLFISRTFFWFIWSCYVLSLTTLTKAEFALISWIIACEIIWHNWDFWNPTIGLIHFVEFGPFLFWQKIGLFVPALINKTVSHCVRWQRFFVYTNLLLVQTISRLNIFNLQGTRIEKGKKELPSPGDRYQYPFKIVWF